MTAHVVVGVDGSPSSQAAVEWAADDAVRRGCALRIVHVCEPWIYDIPLQTPPGFRDSMHEYCQGVLEAAAALARERVPGIEGDTVLETGRPVEILRHEAEDAEQVVLGSRGRGGFTGLLLGSISLALAGHVAVPVVVVRGDQERTYDEVVVGFDTSPHSAAALEYAFEEAARLGARLHTIHTWQMPVIGQGATAYAPLIEEISEAGRRLSADMLAPWREKYPQVKVEETAVYGHPVAVICEASQLADLVVVGSHGLGGLARPCLAR